MSVLRSLGIVRTTTTTVPTTEINNENLGASGEPRWLYKTCAAGSGCTAGGWLTEYNNHEHRLRGLIAGPQVSEPHTVLTVSTELLGVKNGCKSVRHVAWGHECGSAGQ